MHVVAVHASTEHSFSKSTLDEIELVRDRGVRGDAHFGATVKHRSRVAVDPGQPNLRQIHLLQEELLRELSGRGFSVSPGQLGENITTSGIDLLTLSVGTQLRMGNESLVEITGLRNPCAQIEAFQSGLLAAVLDRAADGTLVRRSGIMGVVLRGGSLKAGDAIEIAHEPRDKVSLQPV